jgi:RNA polymerase sigma-70 factor (ECF subfamily)
MLKDLDLELVKKFKEDESLESFRALYDRHKDMVFNTAFGICGDFAEAADISQETFILIYRKINRFNFKSRFSTWVYRMTVNVALEKRRQRKGFLSLGEIETRVLKDTKDSPLETVEKMEKANLVNRALDHLSTKLRAIVVLRYFQGLSYEEISAILGISMGTVKSRLFRAHRELSGLLQRFSVTALSGGPENILKGD